MADEPNETGDGDVLADARSEYKRCSDAWNDNRTTALEDIRFARLGEQWPEEVVKQRQIEQRPMLTINKMPSFIRQVVNDSRQNKPQITVQAVDSNADVKTADVLSGIIRNIQTVSSADVAYDTAVEQAVTGGFGYWRVTIGYAYDDSFDLDILIERITNQFSVLGDPNSTAADSSDWDVCFVTDRMPKKTFKRKYGDKANCDWDSQGWSQIGTEWLNDDGVLVAEWWRRYETEREIVLLDDGRIFDAAELDANEDLQIALTNGMIQIANRKMVRSYRVTQTIVSGCDVLQEEKDFPGPYIPIVPVYGDEIIVEGKRYFRGLINGAKDAQRMFNYWRSTATELVALSPRVPWIGPEEAFSADERWDTANVQSHAYLIYGGQTPPQRQPLDTGTAAGALQEALTASDDMKAIIGMYDASLGARSNETSGRAILARQREGDVATFHFIDNVSRAIRHTGKILLGLIPKVYTGERVMRVLGEDGEAKNVPVNQEFPVDPEGNPIPPEQAMAGEQTQIMLALHDLSLGKYDVTVKSGPSFTTRREEAAVQMTEFIRSFPQAAPVIGDIIAENLDWPGAPEIAERLKKLSGNSDEPEIPPELQQQIEQGKQLIEQLQAENEQLKTEKANDQAQNQIDAQKVAVDAQKVEVEKVKAQAAMLEAQTERMKAEAEIIHRQRMAQAGVMMPMQQ